MNDIVNRGREAWAAIKRSPAKGVEDWIAVGAAIRVGRMMNPSDEQITRWGTGFGFRDLPPRVRAGAEKIAEMREQDTTHDTLPTEIEEWYQTRIVDTATLQPRRPKRAATGAFKAVAVAPSESAALPETAQIVSLMQHAATCLQRAADLMREVADLIQQVGVAPKDARSVIDPLIKALEKMRN
ncbi:hypothetical protein [Paraburkholderia sp. RL17-373-BIF-A]|uniref:hypothetical protein n=1 Tax=Paraburkholderia sp. RL17-373-BIF-A TaxID=3031629 RepID=UPI0038B9F4A8